MKEKTCLICGKKMQDISMIAGVEMDEVYAHTDRAERKNCAELERQIRRWML